jgi:hypothetical protein
MESATRLFHGHQCLQVQESRSLHRARTGTERRIWRIDPDAGSTKADVEVPQLLRDFRRLSLERALGVWELANDEERTLLRPILQKKKTQLENRVPAERAKLEQKLRAALSETKAPSPAIPGALPKLA